VKNLVNKDYGDFTKVRHILKITIKAMSFSLFMSLQQINYMKFLKAWNLQSAEVGSQSK